jgi:hypothetical protein
MISATRQKGPFPRVSGHPDGGLLFKTPILKRDPEQIASCHICGA